MNGIETSALSVNSMQTESMKRIETSARSAVNSTETSARSAMNSMQTESMNSTEPFAWSANSLQTVYEQ